MGKAACSTILVALTEAVLGVWAVEPALAGPRWKLIYYRQVGNHVNGGTYTVENHLFREDGSKGAGVGVTNQFNPNTAIWGFATADGWRRIEPDESAFRDVRIYDPGVPTDQSPNFYHRDPADPLKKYSFETHWLYVTDETAVTAYPTQPVYHYDLVNGLNNSSYQEPPGSSSDAFALTTWTQPIYQTFVVPAGINRIVTAKAWPADTEDFRYLATIVRDNGGPINSWPAVGPASLSRQHATPDFIPVAVNWSIHQVPVTPGNRYALKILPQDNMGCNAYATLNDNYPQGHLWLNDLPVADRDLCAVVVGVGFLGEPLIARSPAAITRSMPVGSTLLPDTFTISNAGTGTLNYTITDNVTWMSVSPADGASSGETDTCTITYSHVNLLPAGAYVGTVTIEAAGTANSPQSVMVTLDVQALHTRADIDQDNDVDQSDFAILQACLTGEGFEQTEGPCQPARLDPDSDVDAADMNILLGCYSGANLPVNPACAG